MGYRRALERMSAVCKGMMVLVHDARRYCTRNDMGVSLKISKKKCERCGREGDNA